MRRTSLPVLILVLLAGPAAAQVKFERKFPEGAKQTSQIETSTHQILTIGPQDIETKQRQFVITTVAYGKRAADGTLAFEMQNDKFQSELELPGGITFSFDSGDPDKKAQIPQLEGLADAMRAASKTKIKTILDAKNQIKAVELLGNPAEKLPPEFKGQFDPESRKKAMQQELAILPDKPVKKGDTWTRTTESNLGAGQTLTVDSTFEYTGAVEKDGKTLDKIVGKATSVNFTQDPNFESPLKVTGAELAPAESEMVILFDRQKGQTVSTANRVRIKGSLTLSAGGMELPGKLDLTLETKSTLQP